MIPRRIAPRTHDIRRACAKGGAESEQGAGQKDDVQLRPEAARAEFLGGPAVGAGGEGRERDERDGQEGRDGVVRCAHDLEVVVDVSDVAVEGVHLLHDAGDQHGQVQDDAGQVGAEHPLGGPMPAEVGVLGAEDPQGEDEVDDDDDDDAGVDEDVRGDGDGDGGRTGQPDDAHHAGDGARHAEAEEGAAGEEFVGAAEVELQDRHVGDGAEDEEDQEDGEDWGIGDSGGNAAYQCSCGRVGRTWWDLERFVS